MTGDRIPQIERIQTIPTTGGGIRTPLTSACSMRFSSDFTYLFCGNAGENTVSIHKRDAQTGLLDLLCCLPISGDYPKDIALFPDEQHIAVINHASNSITFFHIDYEKGLLVMSSRTIQVNEPNCCVIVELR